MSRMRRLLLLSLLLLAGCRGGPVQQQTDRMLLEMTQTPFDKAPPESAEDKAKTEEKAPPAQAPADAAKSKAPEPEADVQTVALMQAERASEKSTLPKYELKVPPGIPGSEAAPLPDTRPEKMTAEQRQQTIRRLYPELPPLQEMPTAEPGPNGQAYTLADLQKLAVENSPTLRQAASDIESFRGAVVQAKTYQNPIVAYSPTANNNNSNTGARGGYIDQHITMWGKRPLTVAAAQKILDNAVLALKRSRSDLSTNVRNAYFALIVAKETMRVNEALARFTDEIYRLYTGYLASGVVATYEPAPLRAQAYTNRLAYKQAITSYMYAWKQLVATIGLPQLPLTEVSGRVDRLIPYYEYDKVLAHVLANHTDVLTARNGVQIAQYNLKLAQITPMPDVDVNFGYWKEMTLAPYSSYYAATLSFPIPIWDRNKGNIMSAQAALIRAVEESHRVEMFWTNTLAANYANYQNNLYALEYYRRYILPDQVRYYRGIFTRRQVDINASPADLVTAQQALATNVQNYLGILSSLWTAVVSVADPLQTADLFQMAQPRELPELPDLSQMPHWLCPHSRMAPLPVAGPGNGCPANGCPADGCPANACPAKACPANGCPAKAGSPPSLPAAQPAQVPGGSSPATPPPASQPVLPAPRQIDTLPVLPPAATQRSLPIPTDLNQQLMEPPPEIPKRTGVPPTAGEPSSEGGATP